LRLKENVETKGATDRIVTMATPAIGGEAVRAAPLTLEPAAKKAPGRAVVPGARREERKK
jgi:hypothetical protein